MLIVLAAIFVPGIGAQWLSWRLRIPSILPLLLRGFVARPVTGFIEPESLSGKVLCNLIVISAAASWMLAALMAFLLLDIPVSIARLIGAVLVVSLVTRNGDEAVPDSTESKD